MECVNVMKLTFDPYCPQCECGHPPGEHRVGKKRVMKSDNGVLGERASGGLEGFVLRGQRAQKAVDEILKNGVEEGVYKGVLMPENVETTSPPKKAKPSSNPDCPVCAERKRRQRERNARHYERQAAKGLGMTVEQFRAAMQKLAKE